MITLYSADITGNPGNCSYPHRHDVVDADSLKAAVCHDYVCAEYKNQRLPPGRLRQRPLRRAF